jgi:AcrR family transcriptional regulator
MTGMSTPDADGPLVVVGDELAMPTERRLILAAERLFAERGIDAVSLRAIMAAAGTNIASVHYHFGSKESLVRALIMTRSDEVSARRAGLLDELIAPGALTAEGLARAFVVPVAEMAGSDGSSWVRFIGGIMATSHPALATLAEGFTQQAVRFTGLMERLHPDWSAGKVRFRLAQAMKLTFNVLGDLQAAQELQQLTTAALSRDEVVEQLLDLVATILSDPARA